MPRRSSISGGGGSRSIPHKLIQQSIRDRQISPYPLYQYRYLRDQLCLPRACAHRQHLAHQTAAGERNHLPRRLPGQLYDDDIDDDFGLSTTDNQFQSRIYFGQFIDDGDLFYCGRQDFSLSVYHSAGAAATDATGEGKEWPLLGRWYAPTGRWTLTDAAYSQRTRLLAFSSIAPVCNFIRLPDFHYNYGGGGDDAVGVQVESWEALQYQFSLDLANDSHSQLEFGIWSLDFSDDGQRLAAGTSDGVLLVREINRANETNNTVTYANTNMNTSTRSSANGLLELQAHFGDINDAKWLGKDWPQLLLTASDDSLIHLWDLRQPSNRSTGGPCGSFIGHTEGVTSIDWRGDGWNCVSAGKDQTIRLWDLRKLSASSEHHAIPSSAYGLNISDWDYRFMRYPQQRINNTTIVDEAAATSAADRTKANSTSTHNSTTANQVHPHDNSVATLHGPEILRTLIRCRYSQNNSGCGDWIYCGSADGTVWLFDYRGLERRRDRRLGPIPAAADYGSYGGSMHHGSGIIVDSADAVVRDCSWHPHLPTIIASSWTGRLYRFDFNC